MTRAAAVHRAKAETETYVVWLQIESDIPISAKQSKSGPRELYLRYTIFEPTTARIKHPTPEMSWWIFTGFFFTTG